MAAHLTKEQLAARFPEIENLVSERPAFVQAWLDAAATSTPISIWGGKTEEAHGFLAMHLMAITPFGAQAALASKDGTSTYGNRRIEMDKQMGAAAAPRTT